MNWYKIASLFQIEIATDVSGIPYRKEVDDIQYLDQEKAKEILEKAIRSRHGRYDPKGAQNMAVRYKFKVTDVKESYDYVTFTTEISPKEEERGEVEVASPEHPRYEHLKQYDGGKTGKVVYKSPKEAIESIPKSEFLAYRGMSWE